MIAVLPPDASILLVGAGNMGGAMLRGWLAAGMRPDQVTVVSPSLRTMPDGVRVVADIPDAGSSRFDVIVLALKPQQLSSLHNERFAGLAPDLLVSVLAGVEIATLGALCDAGAVVRAMPNLPIAIGKGVVALYGASEDAEARGLTEALMARVGEVSPPPSFRGTPAARGAAGERRLAVIR